MGIWIPLLIFLPMLWAVPAKFLGRKNKKIRDVYVVTGGFTELALGILAMHLFLRNGQTDWDFRLCGLTLRFRLDGFRALYTLIAALMWSLTLLFSPGYFVRYRHRGRYYFFNLLTLGATVGVFLSDELYTTFIFFEIMSFASYPWVAHDESESAMRAAQTYLAVAVLGGMVTLMGLFLLQNSAGSLAFDDLRTFAASAAPASMMLPGLLVFFGFAAKAGVFPLHIWLPKAHPVAPAPASALLSGVLTKSGVFGMLVVSRNLFEADRAWGNLMLVLATVTMVLGAALAVFSTDLKRTLACSSMSQIGFILTGIAMMSVLGEENALALRGTLMHMVNHSLLKLDLFLCAGTVYMNLHRLNLNEIRGFGRKKTLLHFCFLMGYLGIIGMPLFNGYLSKSLLHESLLEAANAGNGYVFCEKLFLFSGGMTAAYMTKLYGCLFVEKNRDPALQKKYDAMKDYLPFSGKLALTASALIIPLLGMLPDPLMTGIGNLSVPFLRGSSGTVTIAFFSGENLKGAAISLAIGLVLYGLNRKILRKDGQELNRLPEKLDLENSMYRPLINRGLVRLGGFVAKCCDRLIENPFVMKLVPKGAMGLAGVMNRIVENPVARGIVGEGSTALARCADQALDSSVVLLRKTLFHPQKESEKELSLGESLLLWLGRGLNLTEKAWIHLRGLEDIRKPRDYVSWLMAVDRERLKTNRYVTRSVSFGLLLLAAALCGTLIFLLLRATGA